MTKLTRLFIECVLTLVPGLLQDPSHPVLPHPLQIEWPQRPAGTEE